MRRLQRDKPYLEVARCLCSYQYYIMRSCVMAWAML